MGAGDGRPGASARHEDDGDAEHQDRGDAGREHRPVARLVRGLGEADEREPEHRPGAESHEQRAARAGRGRLVGEVGLPGDDAARAHRDHDPEEGERRRVLTGGEAPGDRDHRGDDRGDRRDHTHAPGGQAPVQEAEPRGAQDPGDHAERDVAAPDLGADEDRDHECADERGALRDEQHPEGRRRAAARPPRKSPDP